MKRNVRLLALIILSALFIVGCKSKEGREGEPPPCSFRVVQLKQNMRKLFEDRIAWTRNAMFCLVDGLPGTDQVIKRLLQNQTDLGNALKPYYGDDAAAKLTALFDEHINFAADWITASKTGDTVKAVEFDRKLQTNADAISMFLSKANPNWKYEEIKKLMDDHMSATKAEALARVKRDYEADVAAYDKVHDGVLQIADFLSDGIVRQYPDKF